MKDKLLQRADELIAMGNTVLSTRRRDTNSAGESDLWLWGESYHFEVGGPDWVDSGMMRSFRAASLSFIGRVYGEAHSHFTEFSGSTDGCRAFNVEHGLGVLHAIREEIAGDWLFTVKGWVTAEVFTDYIEMAEHLSETGYKDPAAVIAGTTLEEHLRQLCRKNGISVVRQKGGKDIPLTGNPLNNELARANVYSKLDHKNVTAWLDLRNKAAHGEYKEYNAEQVKGMTTGIAEFMSRVSV